MKLGFYQENQSLHDVKLIQHVALVRCLVQLCAVPSDQHWIVSRRTVLIGCYVQADELPLYYDTNHYT